MTTQHLTQTEINQFYYRLETINQIIISYTLHYKTTENLRQEILDYHRDLRRLVFEIDGFITLLDESIQSPVVDDLNPKYQLLYHRGYELIKLCPIQLIGVCVAITNYTILDLTNISNQLFDRIKHFWDNVWQ